MKTFIPSFLDKLIDGVTETLGTSLCYSLDEMKDSVARDVENLLNARSCSHQELASFPNVQRSIVTFGLMDISSMSLLSVADRDSICAAIRGAISTHDSRLVNVNVDLSGDAGARSSAFQFVIHARLRLDPLDEPVKFEAVLDPGSASYSVQRRDTRSRRADSH